METLVPLSPCTFVPCLKINSLINLNIKQKANSFTAQLLHFFANVIFLYLSYPFFWVFIEKGEENGLYATLATGFFLETSVPNPAKLAKASNFGQIKLNIHVSQV